MDSLPSPDSFSEEVGDLELRDTSEIVLLAVCANQEPLDSDWVPTLDIRNLVRDTDGEVDTATKLDHLVDEGYVERSNGGTYQLTTKGMKRCLSVLDFADTEGGELAFTNPDIQKEVYQQYVPKHKSYCDLIDEINAAYRIGHNTSVAVLIRRLFEDLTWEISTTLYNDTTQFLTDDGNPLNFGPNLSKLMDNKQPLRGKDPRITNSDEIKSFLNNIDELRQLGNQSAHGIRTDLSREDLREKSDTTTKCVEISYSLLHTANQSP